MCAIVQILLCSDNVAESHPLGGGGEAVLSITHMFKSMCCFSYSHYCFEDRILVLIVPVPGNC